METTWKKNTAIFLTAQMISLFGSALVQFAITWHITLVTQSGFYMTLAIICGFVPTLLLSPFAGVWADRYDRKVLVMVSDGCIAVTTLILAISILFGYRELWPLFAALGIRSFGSAVQMPCIGAILPSIVPEEHLTRINGINSSAQALINLLSPMLSAVLLKSAPYFSIFLIDFVTAAVAIAVMLFLFQLPKRDNASFGGANNYLLELKGGFSYVAKTAYLRNMFVFFALFFFTFAPAAFLTPLQTTRNYGEDEFFLMAIEVAFSIGMLIGGIVIATWGGFQNKVYSMSFAAFMMAGCTLLLGFSIPFWSYLAVMGLFGLSMPIFGTPAMVMLQERVDPDYLGRVLSVMTMISSSLMPLGMLFFGPLADVLNIEWLLIGTGIAMVLLAALFVSNQALLQAGRMKEKLDSRL
jgi:DHA3 family macrolide efflux protein-like MFS transporter